MLDQRLSRSCQDAKTCNSQNATKLKAGMLLAQNVKKTFVMGNVALEAPARLETLQERTYKEL